MHLLVTGGAGFIGSNFVRKWNEGFYPYISKVTVVDCLTYAGNLQNLEGLIGNPNYNFVKYDICDLNNLSEIFHEVDCVINFAAESHVDRSITNSKQFMLTNILGVHTILQLINNVNSKIRFIQVSTDEVYGSIKIGSWKEDAPLQPNSPYSASKASAEMIARSYNKTFNIDVVITRCSNNYGPFHNPEKLIPLAITNLINNKKIPVYGDGSNMRDWLHVDDHCRALYLAIIFGKAGSVYNIGGGTEISNFAVLKKILAIMGGENSSLDFVEDRKGHDFRYSVDCTKIQSELGFKPTISFDEGLKNTIDWYQKNSLWWGGEKKPHKIEMRKE